MKNLIRLLEVLSANLLILLNYLMPKHKCNKRVLVYADMGIGDLVMFMPVIKILLEYGYELTFYVNRKVDKEILQKHFPQCSQQISGHYGWSLNNFHGTYHKQYFWKMIRLRIPHRVGHAWNKWERFFNHRVHFELYGWYEPDKNMELIYQFVPPDIPIVQPMFFETEQYPIPEDYILIQPFSSTDPRKNIGVNKWIDIICCENISDIVLIGNILEGPYMKPIQNYFKPFVNVWILDCLNIFQAAYCIQNATKFFCLESGLAHISSALGVNATVFYHKDTSNSHAFHANLKYIEC